MSANETTTSAPAPKAEVPRQPARRTDPIDQQRVVIRPYPKIIVYYPTMLGAIVCGMIVGIFGANAAVVETASSIFLLLFFMNTIIMAFEFPRMTAVAVVLLVVAILLAVLLLNRYLGVLHFVQVLLEHFNPKASPQFYFSMAGIFLFVFCVAWIVTRFDYWEVLNNELLHHHGPFGDLERFPAPQLKLDKEIPDIFEFVLLGTGRLIFYPTSERRAIILDTVLSVDRIESRVKQLLGALDVRMSSDMSVPTD
jgi:hypothetical protein